MKSVSQKNYVYAQGQTHSIKSMISAKQSSRSSFKSLTDKLNNQKQFINNYYSGPPKFNQTKTQQTESLLNLNSDPNSLRTPIVSQNRVEERIDISSKIEEQSQIKKPPMFAPPSNSGNSIFKVNPVVQPLPVTQGKTFFN